MAAPPRIVTFYLDADVPVAVRRAIAGCRSDVLHAGAPGAPDIDTKDPEWLSLAGRERWVVISRDKHIRRKPAELRAVMDYGVRLFVLTSAGNLTRWDTLDLLVRRWPEITTAADNNVGPFIFSVTRNGVRPVHPPDLLRGDGSQN
jgi:hypothetical protein